MQQQETGGVWLRAHALLFVFAKWDKCRKLDLPLLRPNRAKGQVPKICNSSKCRGTSEDTGPLRLESLALSPCPHNATALLQEMEWGQAVARWDTALTDELAARQSHHNQEMWCFEPKRPKSLWGKNAYSATTNTALTLNGTFTLHSKIKLYTRNPYTQKCLSKHSCSPKSCIWAPKCNKMSQDGINSYSWWRQSCSQNSTWRGNLAPRNRCNLSFVCHSPADQLPAVHQLNIRGLTQLWYRVISLFCLWAVSHIFTFP